MTGVRMHLHPEGIDALLADPKAAALVSGGAASVAKTAAEIVPKNTGDASRSYHYRRARRTATGLVATAYTSDPFGHLVEWGSVHNPAYAPLRRAAERLGFRVKVIGKGGD